ncbi:MAG TPA: hypothetical protein DCS93_24685 [Microscillaceae bacterium]|nr:hypothetical protein [Microscillaceae bacterium]
MITEDQIEQALDCLKKEEFVTYFELMDDITLPVKVEEEYQQLKNWYIKNSKPNIQQLLIKFMEKMKKPKRNPFIILLTLAIIVGGGLAGKYFTTPGDTPSGDTLKSNLINIRGYFVDAATSKRVTKQGTVFIKGQTSTKTLVNGEGGFTLRQVRWKKGAALEYVLELKGDKPRRYPVYLNKTQLYDGVYEVEEVVIELLTDVPTIEPDPNPKPAPQPHPKPIPVVKTHTIKILVDSKFYNGFEVKVNGQVPEMVKDDLFYKVIRIPTSINAKIDVYATNGKSACSKTISIDQDTTLEFINC